jgi:hypothetical protein
MSSLPCAHMRGVQPSCHKDKAEAIRVDTPGQLNY